MAQVFYYATAQYGLTKAADEIDALTASLAAAREELERVKAERNGYSEQADRFIMECRAAEARVTEARSMLSCILAERLTPEDQDCAVVRNEEIEQWLARAALSEPKVNKGEGG
jgi:hypothetical protein